MKIFRDQLLYCADGVAATKNVKKTLRDVAQAAGVSLATVSRIANRTVRVNGEIEKRVREAAERLGVNLDRRTDHRVLAFLLGNRSLLHPFHSQLLVGAESYCAERDYVLLYFPWRYAGNVPWPQLVLPRILRHAGMVDGCLLAGLNTPNLLDRLDRLGLPFSAYGPTVEGPWAPERHDVVWLDGESGGYEMTRYLLSLGHQNIWLIANVRRPWSAPAHRGYCRALQEVGLPPLVNSVDSDNEQENGFLSTKQILRGGNPVDAIFCGSDATAHGVYSALRELGIRVPDDISVAGFNDTIEATLLHPPLTSVRGFCELVGRTMAEFVTNRIADPRLPPQQRVIPCQVIRRESCRPAPSRASAPL